MKKELTNKKAIWNQERTIKLTPRYIDALKEVILAEIKMMQNNNLHMSKEDWTWGEVVIENLSCSSGLSWTFGGEEDKPDGMVGKARVIIK